MEVKNKNNILGINILYFFMAIALLTIGTMVQSLNIKTGLIITEYFIVLMPGLAYLKLKGVPIAKYLRLNRLPVKHGLLIVFITILFYPVAMFFNLIVLTLLSSFGPLQQPPIPTASSAGEYIILLIIIALSPGICEEVFFRGLLMRGYEGIGKIQAIVISSVLFGIIHFNLQNIAGTTVLGLIFGILVYKTNSLYAGIIGHATNNGIAVTIGYIMNTAAENVLPLEIETVQAPGMLQMAAATIAIGVIALVTGIIAFGLFRIIIKDTEKANRIDEACESVPLEQPNLWAYSPVFLTVLIYLFMAFLQINQMVKS